MTPHLKSDHPGSPTVGSDDIRGGGEQASPARASLGKVKGADRRASHVAGKATRGRRRWPRDATRPRNDIKTKLADLVGWRRVTLRVQPLRDWGECHGFVANVRSPLSDMCVARAPRPSHAATAPRAGRGRAGRSRGRAVPPPTASVPRPAVARRLSPGTLAGRRRRRKRGRWERSAAAPARGSTCIWPTRRGCRWLPGQGRGAANHLPSTPVLRCRAVLVMDPRRRRGGRCRPVGGAATGRRQTATAAPTRRQPQRRAAGLEAPPRARGGGAAVQTAPPVARAGRLVKARLPQHFVTQAAAGESAAAAVACTRRPAHPKGVTGRTRPILAHLQAAGVSGLHPVRKGMPEGLERSAAVPPHGPCGRASPLDTTE